MILNASHVHVLHRVDSGGIESRGQAWFEEDCDGEDQAGDAEDACERLAVTPELLDGDHRGEPDHRTYVHHPECDHEQHQRPAAAQAEPTVAGACPNVAKSAGETEVVQEMAEWAAAMAEAPELQRRELEEPTQDEGRDRDPLCRSRSIRGEITEPVGDEIRQHAVQMRR